MKQSSTQIVLYLSAIIIMAITVFTQNKLISAILVLLYLLSTLLLLYNNSSSLSGIPENSPKNRTLKSTLIFCFIIILFGVMGIVLVQNNLFTEMTEKIYASGLVVIIMLWLGNISCKLPFNRNIGLRLPWTIADEETWIVAHRVLGYISLPLVVVYFGLMLV